MHSAGGTGVLFPLDGAEEEGRAEEEGGKRNRLALLFPSGEGEVEAGASGRSVPRREACVAG